MRPTEGWMRSTYLIYNEKYFGGRLREPEFVTSESETEFGHYGAFLNYGNITRRVKRIFRRGTLSLSRYYNRPESELISTLLHEMIHQYIFEVLRRVPRDEHGKEFSRMASALNADGWNICESHAAIIGD